MRLERGFHGSVENLTKICMQTVQNSDDFSFLSVVAKRVNLMTAGKVHDFPPKTGFARRALKD